MSKTISALKKLEQARLEKVTKKVERKEKSWLGKAFLAIGFILVVGLNVNIFLTMNKYSEKMDNVILAVVKSQDSVSDNTEQMASLSEGLGEIGAGIKDLKGEVSGLGMKVSGLEGVTVQIDKLSENVSGLEKDRDTTKFSLRTLTKAKNTLFKKVGDLRVEVQELKNTKLGIN